MSFESVFTYFGALECSNFAFFNHLVSISDTNYSDTLSILWFHYIYILCIIFTSFTFIIYRLFPSTDMNLQCIMDLLCIYFVYHFYIFYIHYISIVSLNGHEFNMHYGFIMYIFCVSFSHLLHLLYIDCFPQRT